VLLHCHRGGPLCVTSSLDFDLAMVRKLFGFLVQAWMVLVVSD
jgi:hypothetical protein